MYSPPRPIKEMVCPGAPKKEPSTLTINDQQQLISTVKRVLFQKN